MTVGRTAGRESRARTAGRMMVATLLVYACSSPSTSAPRPAPSPVTPPAPRREPRAAPAPSRPASPSGGGRVPRDVGDTTIRVLISSGAAAERVTSSAGISFFDRDGRPLVRVFSREPWRVEHDGRRIRAVRSDGAATQWTDGLLWAQAANDALLEVNGKPYRGLFLFEAGRGDSGVVAINVARIDDYLLGVVPLEIGTRAESDSAAVQAQAVAARSYAFMHLSSESARAYDVTASTADQVYGGAAAETPVASEAVESTRGLVLQYGGRVVNAPYHSTCGGATAAASEVWHAADEPYLQSVSDRIPGTDRYYCDIAPRFKWTRTLDAKTLNAAVARYLEEYTQVPGHRTGAVQDVAVASHTASGRVAQLTLTTDRGNFLLRGNDIRFVLRPPGGEILNSTYFSVETRNDRDGALSELTIRGQGYGHGVGMCQWGAIGRARAGQDYLTILRTYYPGTTVAPAPW